MPLFVNSVANHLPPPPRLNNLSNYVNGDALLLSSLKTKYTHTFGFVFMIAAHILSIALAGFFKTYFSATQYILDLYYTCKLIAQNLSMTIIGKKR